MVSVHVGRFCDVGSRRDAAFVAEDGNARNGGVKECSGKVAGVAPGDHQRHGVHGPVETERRGTQQQPQVKGRQEEEG